MKNYIIIIITLLLTLPVIAQEEIEELKPFSTISVLGRFTNNEIQLIYFPDKNISLYQGLEKGFLIERATLNESIKSLDDLKFSTLDVVFPYSKDEWKKAIENSKGEERESLETAKEFYDNRNTKSGGEFNFDKGIKEMREQKFKEDFEYLLFVMPAIKENNVAKALGLSYTDKTIEINKKYVYRISLKEAIKGYTVGNMLSVVETIEVDEKINREIYVKTWDGKLTFIWDENDMVTGAHVERKNNSTGNYELLNKNASLNSSSTSSRNSYTDENLTNYTTYEYRFYGFNPFGEKVYFGEAKGMPKDFTPPSDPSIISAKNDKPEEININWKMPIMDADLKGFVVARSTKNKGDFQLLHANLLPKNTTNYTDKTFSKEKDNYYIVQAIDTSGNISSSRPYFVNVIDSIPPVKPEFIEGKIDSLGIVTLDIQLNKERDVMGYRLFRANAADHEFSVIYEGFHEKDTVYTKPMTVFKDTVTIKSLTPYIYYKIKALDYNFNQSPYSDVLKVKRPDYIVPETPVFKNVKVGKDTIELEFILSGSEDVIEQTLYRKTDLDQPWEKYAALIKDQNLFIDKEVKTGVKYYYSLQAMDDSNNLSDFAVPVMGKPYDDGTRPPVENLKLNVEKNQVILTWNYKEMNKDTYFVIYKKNRKGQLIQYKSVAQLAFNEKANLKDEYAVKVFTKNGGQSKISEILRVEKL